MWRAVLGIRLAPQNRRLLIVLIRHRDNRRARPKSSGNVVDSVDHGVGSAVPVPVRLGPYLELEVLGSEAGTLNVIHGMPVARSRCVVGLVAGDGNKLDARKAEAGDKVDARVNSYHLVPTRLVDDRRGDCNRDGHRNGAAGLARAGHADIGGRAAIAVAAWGPREGLVDAPTRAIAGVEGTRVSVIATRQVGALPGQIAVVDGARVSVVASIAMLAAIESAA